MKHFVHGENVIIRLYPVLNESQGELLHRYFEGFIRKGAKAFILDLSHVSFIDRSGVTALESLMERIRAIGGWGYLYGGTKEVREHLSLSQLCIMFMQ